jgi:hypothetical protein
MLIKTVVIHTSIQNAKIQTHVKTVYTQVHSSYQILFLSYSHGNCQAEFRKAIKFLGRIRIRYPQNRSQVMFVRSFTFMAWNLGTDIIDSCLHRKTYTIVPNEISV